MLNTLDITTLKKTISIFGSRVVNVEIDGIVTYYYFEDYKNYNIIKHSLNQIKNV